jgi:DNA primase
VDSLPPLFPDAWVNQVYQRANIVDVVSNYLPLKQQGRNHWGLCPFHNEKTPSFSVSADNNVYHCFGCKAGGNVVQFVMEMEKLTYPEALRHLAKMYGLPPPPETRADPEEQRLRSRRERLMEANREAAQFYFDQLWQPQGKAALEWTMGSSAGLASAPAGIPGRACLTIWAARDTAWMT